MPKPKAPLERNALAHGPERGEHGLVLKGRLWVEKNGKTFLSWGRVVLLERIAEHGSVSAAARSMGISYSHAWNLVEEMNCLAPQPLVEKQTGGARGGGARLTPAGEEAVAFFWNEVSEFQAWLHFREMALE
jgi:molybdate transport system regulatory protein